MEGPVRGTIAVVGATGMQGSAVVRALRTAGWTVRALTRDPTQTRARALVDIGAEIVTADTADPAAVERAFRDVHGIYNVQNHHISGYEGELVQARNVADAALRVGARHVVYGAAGVGRGDTGVGSWDVKVRAAAYMRQLGLPTTVLRPMAFMELMTEKRFYPAMSTWHVMPKLMGASRPVGWLAVEDLAAIVTKVFDAGEPFIGHDIALTADVVSIDGCRQLWGEVTGRSPKRFPMPVRLFERFVGTDETTMWRWLRTHEIELDPGPTLHIHPEALTVEAWLQHRAAAAVTARAPGPEQGTASP